MNANAERTPEVKAEYGLEEGAVEPAPAPANHNGEPALDTAEKPLPLFEMRVEGCGPLAIESISQSALVDYIGNAVYTEAPSHLIPFRAEFLQSVSNGPAVLVRSIIYIDPGKIILVGPVRIPMGPAERDQDFERMMSDLTKAAPSAEIILVSDEAGRDLGGMDEAEPEDEPPGEDGPK